MGSGTSSTRSREGNLSWSQARRAVKADYQADEGNLSCSGFIWVRCMLHGPRVPGMSRSPLQLETTVSSRGPDLRVTGRTGRHSIVGPLLDGSVTLGAGVSSRLAPMSVVRTRNVALLPRQKSLRFLYREFRCCNLAGRQKYAGCREKTRMQRTCKAGAPPPTALSLRTNRKL